MKCKHCGAENPEKAKFCYKCGKPPFESSLEAAKEPEKCTTQEETSKQAGISSEQLKDEPNQSGGNTDSSKKSDKQGETPSEPSKEEPKQTEESTTQAKDSKDQATESNSSISDSLSALSKELKSLSAEAIDEARNILEREPILKNDTECPFCHSSDCQPMQKSSTTVKQSGYSLSNGCCGMCLLGPFGLLCGLCGTGSRVDIKNETWWTCMKCGKEHISQKSALEKGEAMIVSSYISALVGGILLSLAIWRFGFSLVSLILTAFAFGMPIGVWMSISELLNEELGYSVLTILTPEKKKTYLYQFIGCIAIVVALGLFSMPLLKVLSGQ